MIPRLAANWALRLCCLVLCNLVCDKQLITRHAAESKSRQMNSDRPKWAYIRTLVYSKTLRMDRVSTAKFLSCLDMRHLMAVSIPEGMRQYSTNDCLQDPEISRGSSIETGSDSNTAG